MPVNCCIYMKNNKLIQVFAVVAVGLFSVACHHDATQDKGDALTSFPYPESKYWAHGVNTVELGREKAPLFGGLEVDINYSAWQDQLFVGHDLEDTINGLTFDMWLDSLPQPVTNCLWLDTKSLAYDNASRTAHLILEAVRRHGIADRVMVENWDRYALHVVKDSGLHVILWVDNPWWSGISEEEFRIKTQQQIDFLHPDAISGDYHNFPRLSDSFPDQNIHIWDTPRNCNDTNVGHSRMIAGNASVRVVLVDYPFPPDMID